VWGSRSKARVGQEEGIKGMKNIKKEEKKGERNLINLRAPLFCFSPASVEPVRALSPCARRVFSLTFLHQDHLFLFVTIISFISPFCI